MVHGSVSSTSKSKKHRHKSESSSADSSFVEAPRKLSHKSRHKERARSTDSSDLRKKPTKHSKRKRERKESSSSDSTAEHESPPKRNRKSEDQTSRDFVKSEKRRHQETKEKRNRTNDTDKDKYTKVRIKKEEDFDRRQDEIRRRRRENERRDRERPRHDVRVKQEPLSDNERGQQDKKDYRSRSRRDMEQQRRENDARRAEAWQKRERQGGQNAEALLEDNSEEKEKPNLGLSGALTEDTNTFRGVVIKYSEPPEARVPKKKWRLYPFKGDEALKCSLPARLLVVTITAGSYFSGMVEDEKPDGTKKRIVKPYIIDLDSANGTFVNNQQIQPRRYVELKEKDVIKFAYSSREYVLIHDKSDTTEVDVSGEESDD